MENFININEMMRNPLVNQNYKNYGNDEIKSIMDTDINKAENKQTMSVFGNPFILGICYIPMQEWEQVYDEDTAFSAGTIFPGLNKPFLGGGK